MPTELAVQSDIFDTSKPVVQRNFQHPRIVLLNRKEVWDSVIGDVAAFRSVSMQDQAKDTVPQPPHGQDQSGSLPGECDTASGARVVRFNNVLEKRDAIGRVCVCGVCACVCVCVCVCPMARPGANRRAGCGPVYQ